MRRLALWTSAATIAILNIVIWLGLLGKGDSFQFGLMLAALHLALPVSSVLMVALLVKGRHWAAASLFAAVVIGMLVVLGLRLASVHLSGGVHLAGDLFVLNVYLLVVPWYRQIHRQSIGAIGGSARL